MNKMLSHFQNNDPVLYPWALKAGKLSVIKKDKPENYFLRITEQIINQQLSEKAGDTIFRRFKSLFPTQLIEPSHVLEISHSKLRQAGLSNAKAKYIKNLAIEVVEEKFHIHTLGSLSDEEVIAEMTKLKGIGPWTAEMFLMFVLGREDVFSYGDLGLRNGIIKIYGFKNDPPRKRVEKIISRWTPYKSYASRILWISLDIP